MSLILIAEYAAQHGRSASAVYDKIQRGNLPAVKIGRQWFIEADAPYEDGRVKSGAYIGARLKRQLRAAADPDPDGPPF